MGMNIQRTILLENQMVLDTVRRVIASANVRHIKRERIAVSNIYIDDDEYDEPHPLVYIFSEQVFGIIISYGAYASIVRYEKGGILHEVLIENDDLLDGV